MTTRTFLTLSLLLVAGCLHGPRPAGSVAPAAAPATKAEVERHYAGLREAIQASMPAYVFIGGGSGSVISPDGYVVTNHHVVGSAKKWRVRTAEGRTHIAEVVGSAPATDLALLKIRDAEDLPFLPLGDSDALSAGEVVYAIGNPFNMGSMDHTPTVSKGVVGAIGVDRTAARDAVVTDTPINPGNSGGPLINLRGELIGVNGQIASRFGIKANAGTGYAISSNQLKRFLEALKTAEGGRIQLGNINGAKFEQNPRGGVRVANVLAESPAEEAGLQENDTVVRLADWPVSTVVQIKGLAGRYPEGTRVPITVKRKGRTRKLNLSLETREAGALGIAFAQNRASLEIARVIPGGPADKAGLQAGDRIRGVAGRELRNRRQIQRIMPRITPGQKVPMTILRDGELLEFTVEAAAVSELRRLKQQSQEEKAP